MENKSGQKQGYLILILGLLTAIGPLSIDMYLPAFPAIAKGLHTSVSSVMLSLSSFFIGISAGQLIYGPLLERFGRKKPLYIGLIVYAIASIGCAATSTVNGLIVFRLFQALGGCVGMVASRAMVRDLFEVKDNAKVFSTLMLVVAVSPIIAPTLGGYITAYLGWRYIFGVLIAVISMILAGVYFLLPESKKPDTGFSLRPAAIIKNFTAIIKNPQFAIYTFTGAIAYAGLYAYISGSPYVFMVFFGVSEKHYGWIFAFIAAGLISASQCNNFLLRSYRSEQVMKGALYTQTAIGIILVSLSFSGTGGLYTTITLIFLFLSCQGFILPNASALSMAPFAHNAGSASALMGFIQMCIGAIMSAVVSLLQNNSILPMTGVMAFASLMASVLITLGGKIILKDAGKTLVEEEDVEMIGTL
jgi:DHA1 family bicyclomycin/chloramphenicol resistance-like MFS transporter